MHVHTMNKEVMHTDDSHWVQNESERDTVESYPQPFPVYQETVVVMHHKK